MHYNDLATDGYKSLRHHDRSFDVQYRLVSFGVRIGGPDQGMGSGFDSLGLLQGVRNNWGGEDTHGDILNWGMWQVDSSNATAAGPSDASGSGGAGGSKRTIPGWAQAWAAVAQDGAQAPDDSGLTTTSAQTTVDVQPVFDKSWNPDTRFVKKTLKMPPNITSIPAGTVGVVVTGTNEYDQEDLFLPVMANTILAPHHDGKPSHGTTVWDLDSKDKPDKARNAHFQTLTRVWQIGDPQRPNRILEALCGKIGEHALAIQMGSARGGLNSRAAFADYGEDFGPDPKQVIGLGSWQCGGPFHPGSRGDKHSFGANGDDDAITSLHIPTTALFYRNKGEDAPLAFGGLWQKPSSYGKLWETFLRYDPDSVHPHVTGAKQGLWRWETRVPLFIGGGGGGGEKPPSKDGDKVPSEDGGGDKPPSEDPGRKGGSGEGGGGKTGKPPEEEPGFIKFTVSERGLTGKPPSEDQKPQTKGPFGDIVDDGKPAYADANGTKVQIGDFGQPRKLPTEAGVFVPPPQQPAPPPSDGGGFGGGFNGPPLAPAPGGTPEYPTDVQQPQLPPQQVFNPGTGTRFGQQAVALLQTLNEIGAPGFVMFPQMRNIAADDYRNSTTWGDQESSFVKSTVPAVVRLEAIGAETKDGQWSYFQTPGTARNGQTASGGLWIMPPNVNSTDIFDGTPPASFPNTYLGIYQGQIGFGTPTIGGGVGSGVNIRLSGSTLQGDITDANGNVTSTTQLFPVSGSYVPLGTSSGTGSLAGGTSSTTSTANQATAYGNSANATGTKSTAIGYNTTASGTGSIAIGGSASSSGTGSIALGDPCYAPGTRQITIGYEANSLNNSWTAAITIGGNAQAAQSSVVIGDGITMTQNIANSQNVVIGNSASTVNANNAVVIGYGAYSDARGTAIGYLSTATVDDVAVGYNAYTPATPAIAIGRDSYTGANNSCAIGSSTYPITTYYFGKGFGTSGNFPSPGVASPSIVTVKNTDAFGSDIAGANFIVEPSLATGLATSGSFSVKIGQVGASGTTLQTSSEIFNVAATGATVTGKLQSTTISNTVKATTTTTASVDATATIWPCDTTGGGFTLTLPTAVGIAGRHYWIKKISSDANNLTLGTTGGQTIDGAATQVTATQYAGWHVISDGANWQIAFPGGAGSTQTLSQTLGYGNTTSGKNIVLTAGDTFSSSTSTFTIEATGGTILATKSVAPKTANYNVVSTESRRVFTNEGAGSKPYLTLPTAAAGLEYSAYVQNSQGLRLVASGSNTIRLDSTVSSAGGYCESTVVGSFITLLAVNSNEWITTTARNSWTLG